MTETKRRWEVREALHAINHKLVFEARTARKTLPPSKYERKRAGVKRDNYVSWDKIVF